MKTKLITLLILILAIFLLMTSCSKPDSDLEHPSGENDGRVESTEHRIYSDNEDHPYTFVDVYKHEIDEIEYHLYSDNDGIFVINHTKEVLEVELLKKELGE